MARKVLENVRQVGNWTTYMGAVEGVLRGAGWWQEETFKLMGLTGMAFHFIVEKAACPSSVTVYPWVREHGEMMTRLGVYAEDYENWAQSPVFALAQAEAIRRIKASIDRGVAVVAWAPTPVLEFGIINGYDDEDGVFMVQHCLPFPADPLLYTNLGKSEVPMLYYQVFKGAVPVDREQSIREALRFGVRQWNATQHERGGGAGNHASGRKGYDHLVGTLERGDYNPFGLPYLVQVYAAAKDDLAHYLAFLAATGNGWRALGEAAQGYGEVAEKFARMAQLVPFGGPQAKPTVLSPVAQAEMLALARACQQLEERAMATIATVVA
jgi:hypothetical protein